MADIFFSYKSGDRDQIAPIVAFLEAEGWSVFWDQAITAGEKWDQRIETELQAARCVVVAWSAAAAKSQWVRNEARDAKTREILVPIALDDTRMPLEFSNVQAERFLAKDSGIDMLAAQRLVAAINRVLAPQSAMPAVSMPPRRVAGTSRAGRWFRPSLTRLGLLMLAAAVAGVGGAVMIAREQPAVRSLLAVALPGLTTEKMAGDKFNILIADLKNDKVWAQSYMGGDAAKSREMQQLHTVAYG